MFATGGIGGVHRGAEKSFDISADIIELGKTPVTVVCAGIKSILDIGKTLEMLETHGVPVLGYQVETFPAFFTNDSGFKSPLVVQSCSEVAAMMVSQHLLGVRSGIVLGVPNPQPAAMEKMQYAIDFALVSAANEGVSGSAVTPYVLQRIEKLTDGDSLQANVALILNNAKLAAMVAEQHCSLLRSGSYSTSLAGFSLIQQAQSKCNDFNSTPEVEVVATSAKEPPSPPLSPALTSKTEDKMSVLVVGGAVMDIIGQITSEVRMGSSNPGTVSTSFGGVARNVAESIAKQSRSSVTVRLATALADDFNGRSLLAHCQQIGVDTSAVKVPRALWPCHPPLISLIAGAATLQGLHGGLQRHPRRPLRRAASGRGGHGRAATDRHALRQNARRERILLSAGGGRRQFVERGLLHAGQHLQLLPGVTVL